MKINILEKYGLDSFFTKQITNSNDEKNLIRIVSGSKKSFRGISAIGEIDCLIKGSVIHHKIEDNSFLPKVGDFAILENDGTLDSNNTYFIQRVLVRKNELKRKIVGKKHEDQIIATNVDFSFITVSADMEINIRRLERLIIACLDSNIKPLIILTKTDLTSNIESQITTLNNTFKDIEVIPTSFLNINSVLPLITLIKNNKTAVFIGMSGTGKSTITNMLLNADVQKTQTVSKEQNKGKHTTTHRELFLLESGGVIIDNPGIKEFGLWLDDENSLNYGFDDVIELAKNCKFANCSHTAEPNCAIKKAIAEGILDEKRLESFQKLKNEQNQDQILKNKHLHATNKKKIAKSYKNFQKYSHKKFLD